MNRGLIVIAVVVALGVAILGYQMGSSGAGEAALTPVVIDGIDDQALRELAQPVMLGDPDAPVSIVEFGDYQCPGCQTFNTTVKPQIDLAYVQTGQANFVFYDFPIMNLHTHAFIAARAARCAGDQDQFWAYHDALFANQGLWARSAGAPLGEFDSYAADLGLDEGEFGDCLRSDRHADVVTANLQLGRSLGVPSTPTVMISDGSGQVVRPTGSGFAEIREIVGGMLGETADAASDTAGNAGGGGA